LAWMVICARVVSGKTEPNIFLLVIGDGAG
jgi:hypothetical protein